MFDPAPGSLRQSLLSDLMGAPGRSISVSVGPERIELDRAAFDGLVGILEGGGLVFRNPETGQVIDRSPMADLASRLRDLVAEAKAEYRPDAADRGLLIEVLNFWMGDDPNGIPPAVVALRHALVDYGPPSPSS